MSNLHSYLSGIFQVANKEFTKPQWQLQEQKMFVFLSEPSISKLHVSHAK